MSAELTATEHRAVALAGELAGVLREIVGDGPNADADIGELVLSIHHIQHAVMAQAAARAHPELYRPLGARWTRRA